MTDVPIAPATRRIPRRLVVIGVALYCALAWAVVFKAVDLGVTLVRGGAIHYATATTSRE